MDELNDDQKEDYRNQVLGKGSIRVAIEAAGVFGWERYVGDEGTVIGMKGFGASAPASDLYNYFGITSDAAIAAVRARL